MSVPRERLKTAYRSETLASGANFFLTIPGNGSAVRTLEFVQLFGTSLNLYEYELFIPSISAVTLRGFYQPAGPTGAQAFIALANPIRLPSNDACAFGIYNRGASSSVCSITLTYTAY